MTGYVFQRCDSWGSEIDEEIEGLAVPCDALLRHRCDGSVFYFRPGDLRPCDTYVDDNNTTRCSACKKMWPVRRGTLERPLEPERPHL